MVYNVPKDAVSAHGDIQMSLSLLAFYFWFIFSVFGIGYFYMVHLMKKGPVVLKSDQLTQGENNEY